MLTRNIALLSSGAVLSQCVLLAGTPVLTRYYDPDAFGGLATFSALFGVLSGVSTLRYDLAIPAPRDDQNAHAIGGAVSLASLTSATAIGLVLFLLPLLTPWEVPPYFLLIPVCMVLIAHYGIAQQWSARRGSYSHYSISMLISSVANIGVALVFIPADFRDSMALVTAFALGLATSLGFMLCAPVTGRNVWLSVTQLVHIRSVLAAARQWSDFPRFALPTFLAASASAALPVFILAGTYTQEQVGYFALAMRFLLSPSVLVGAAVLEAMRAELFRRQREGEEMFLVVTKFMRVGLSLGVPFLFLAYYWGGDVLVFVIGQDFAASGDLVAPLVLAALSLILAQPLQSVFLVTGRQQIGLVAQLALTILPNAVLLFSIVGGSALQEALGAYAVAVFAMGACFFVAAWRVTVTYSAARAIHRNGAAQPDKRQ